MFVYHILSDEGGEGPYVYDFTKSENRMSNYELKKWIVDCVTSEWVQEDIDQVDWDYLMEQSEIKLNKLDFQVYSELTWKDTCGCTLVETDLETMRIGSWDIVEILWDGYPVLED